MEPRIKIVAADQGKPEPIRNRNPVLTDLQGYHREIRRAWWGAYLGGARDPIAVAIHRRSLLAFEQGFNQGPDGPEFTFKSVTTAEAERQGWLWLYPELAKQSNRPPSMAILLATGGQVQVHVTGDCTQGGLIDAAHFDGKIKQMIRESCTAAEWIAVLPFIEQPWTY